MQKLETQNPKLVTLNTTRNLKLVNLHTHFPLTGQQIGLVNHNVLLPFQPQAEQFYSVGLHPWDLDQATDDKWLDTLESLLAHPQVLAVGECGIDRTLETPVEKQIHFFRRQLELAEKHARPLILHAVRSYSDLLQLKKQSASKLPWILHGYQANAETTKQLAQMGFYFSLGTALLNDRQKLNQSLAEIPPSQLFFETDESTENIESIYIFAAGQLKTTAEKLRYQVLENYQRIF
ncbi:TatD family hydrolase [Mangrovibacterium diazotrophicum]|uniref:TatD DNase family protein n=1 Tax=Mangrovibacterium diazotrophicum TaxID=1261403 RepID=A0A419VZ99_9BACT|nr:TatD family hydrolase [Mangrovibacterium diazotrophicum]RKD88390.1 TatD DNase family protein [Mangrovibacterium diazotrophicum]